MMNSEHTSYGSAIRLERELRGWSQQELVKQILALCAKEHEHPALDTKSVFCSPERMA